MDIGEVGEFLRSRRARISPGEAGLPSHGRRRVPGLRREEVARPAGMSVDYYVRLEQGRGRMREKTHGRKRTRHPLAGEPEVDYGALAIPDAPDQLFVAYTAPSGSPTAARLALPAEQPAQRAGASPARTAP